ncbi:MULTISPECIES: hypothetical protein [Rufibacter]|uniref:Uncharacterized protein n=1 Tax=Rufibacter quisquiliarum TaxID=1549639 RepID=A0A839GHB5_9BACT|nr:MULTISPECIES: hypothetical protein [Rufibacter]MBA9077013.1 hypothetical protein [Rufibacter quisquiliarum]
MKFIGILLFLAGMVSLLLAPLGIQHGLLLWADNWGSAVGWVIKGTVTLLGLVLYYVNRHQD